MINIKFFRLLLVFSMIKLAACTSPLSYDELAPDKLDDMRHAIEQFRSDDRLQQYFDEAVAIAVVPNTFRAGTGFGGALGFGWLLEEEEVTGAVTYWQFLAGADLGFQFYRQIMFFRTQEAVEKFKAGTFEFSGQANAAVVTWGADLTPSYNNDVALFVQNKAGLLLEASVGAMRYDVRLVTR